MAIVGSLSKTERRIAANMEAGAIADAPGRTLFPWCGVAEEVDNLVLLREEAAWREGDHQRIQLACQDIPTSVLPAGASLTQGDRHHRGVAYRRCGLLGGPTTHSMLGDVHAASPITPRLQASPVLRPSVPIRLPTRSEKSCKGLSRRTRKQRCRKARTMRIGNPTSAPLPARQADEVEAERGLRRIDLRLVGDPPERGASLHDEV